MRAFYNDYVTIRNAHTTNQQQHKIFAIVNLELWVRTRNDAENIGNKSLLLCDVSILCYQLRRKTLRSSLARVARRLSRNDAPYTHLSKYALTVEFTWFREIQNNVPLAESHLDKIH